MGHKEKRHLYVVVLSFKVFKIQWDTAMSILPHHQR